LADQKADADERTEFFMERANEGNEELLDELNELEADAVGEEFTSPVAAGYVPSAAPA